MIATSKSLGREKRREKEWGGEDRENGDGSKSFPF